MSLGCTPPLLAPTERTGFGTAEHTATSEQSMRPIDLILIHCSATPEGREVSADEIRQWHKQRGFSDIGYHFVVHQDGKVETGRPLTQIGAHCRGHNQRSIGICYTGGLARDGKTPKDTRTDAQRTALYALVTLLRYLFPNATLHGHNEYAAKACPSFNVQKEW